MNIDIEKALKFPFEDKGWIRKLIVIFAIQFVISLVASILNLTSNLFSSIIDYGDTTDVLNGSDILLQTLLVSGGIFAFSLLFSLVAIPFKLYISGYFYELTENVMDGESLPLPENQNIKKKIKYGLSIFVITFIPNFAFLMITGLLWIPVILIIFMGIEHNQLISFLGIFGAFLTALIVLVGIFALSLVFIPAMTYIFLEKDSVMAAFSYSDVMVVSKAGWKRFIVVSLLTTAISIIATFFSWIPCISYIVAPVLNIYLMLVYSHLMGRVYFDLDKEIQL